MTDPSTAKHLGEVNFTWPGHLLASNLTVEVDISNLSSCAGVGLRGQSGAYYGFYAFAICSNSYWEIVRYSSTDATSTTILSGKVNANTAFHLKAIANGSVLSLSINGGQQMIIADTAFTSDYYLALVTLSPGASTFSNFVYTPMP